MSSLPSSTAWSRFGMIFLGAGFVLVLGMLWLTNHLHDSRKPTKQTSPSKSGAGQALPSFANSGSNASPSKPPILVSEEEKIAAEKAAANQAAAAELSKSIADALAVLRNPDIADKRAALKALRELLAKADPAVAIAAIRQFLASKEDASTGLRFKVGQNGLLTDAPTMRTFMMDQLGSISARAGTNDAAEVGRETLTAKNSPEEWALAMRNVGWSDPQGSKAYLAEKARELIQYEPWQQARSSGYLQAFDVAAYSGDATFLSDLAPMAQASSPLQQAALVAMDRLSAMAPDKVSDYLNSHPDILADRPFIRADYMGKVNLSDANQRAQAETYLQRSDVSLEEKIKFLGRLGVPAGFVSNNLLTAPQVQQFDLIQRRALVNQTATTWLNSGQYPTLQAPLQNLINSTGPGS